MRTLNKLNPKKIATLNEPGRYSDGGNLYLFISPNGGRRWTFKFRWNGQPKELGLGSAKTVSLAQARELAAACRADLAAGTMPTSPSASRRPSKGATFGFVADGVIDSLAPGWRSTKHRAQWVMTLTEYAKPLRSMPVAAVGTDDVLGVLRPLWSTIPDTAGRLRARIEKILYAAEAQGLRSGANPARWKGHLDHLLPPRQRIEKPHHVAMSYLDIPGFMKRLRGVDLVSARALEFLILTAARTGEVTGCPWEEIAGDLWIIPAGRMKGGREHIVPLSKAAQLMVTARSRGSAFVFSVDGESPMGKSTMERLLERMEVAVTVHGFRSSFRDWAGDCTAFDRDTVEAALAHQLRDHVEAAYRRSTALEKRRQLMEEWATYCGSK